jgi:hypothetical protein
VTERHFELLAQGTRPRQPWAIVTTVAVALLGILFQLMAWSSNDTLGSRLVLALITGVPCALGVAWLVHAQRRLVHPLVARLRQPGHGLVQVELVYIQSGNNLYEWLMYRSPVKGNHAKLIFRFPNRKYWVARVAEADGAELERAARAELAATIAA